MNHWEIVKQQAFKFLKSEEEWNSFVQGKRYKVLKINETNFIIDKITGGFPVTVTKSYVNSSVEKIIQNKIFKRSGSVARAAAVVNLHPDIIWDRINRDIIWSPGNYNIKEDPEKFINDASDDEIAKIQVLINQRKYQTKFRNNLLEIYENKCSISDVFVKEVLEAAHIIGHSESRNNKNSNGILLRADLHILFDKNLLLIHPKKMTIHLHPKIQNSFYQIYQGKKIRQRKDGTNPGLNYLQEKWVASTWTKDL